MRTRARLIPASLFLAGLAGLGVLAACSGGTPQTPSIGITPTPASASGPVLFSVVRVNTDSPVVWSLSGPGSLSGTNGSEVTYAPPQAGANGSATLTATAGALSASVTFTVAPPALAPGQIPGLSAAVQVSYDAQNIPHVSCAAINDCLAAQGYLQARDRLFQMDLFRRTARGQLATLLGAIEVSSDQQFLTFFTTRDGKRVEDEIVANFDSTTAARTAAYVSGINEYIAELKATPDAPLPDEYAQLPYPLTAADIPDWTAQDTVAVGRLQQFQLSETIEEDSGYGLFAAAYGPGAPLADPGKMNAWIRAQETERSYTLPIAGSAAARTPAAARSSELAARITSSLVNYAGVLAQARANVREARGLLGTLGVDTGSNNWVVDAAHSATGQAMVANDPHLQLQYPPLFHLIAMTASDSSGLDIQGGAFPGLPGVLIGRGKHVAWGDTVVGYDVTDLYLEQVEQCTSGGEIPCAHYTGAGGTQIQLLPVTVAIQVRGPSGLTAQPYTVLVNPLHGPFISYDQPSGNGVSMRWTGQEPTNDLPAFLNLALATAVGQVSDVGGSVNTAFAALHAYDTGAQNFVLADDQGNIGYDPHALVPKRPWVGTTGYPWFPLPGDGSAEWGSGSASDNCAGTGSTPPAANCWYADADLPHADASNSSNTGFLVTANSDPAGYGDSNIPISVLHNAPFYLSFDWDDPTGFRHKRISTLLANATAGGGKVSVATMQAIQTDHASSLAGAFIPDINFIAGAAGSSVPPAFTAAVAMLNAWAAVANSPLDCPTGLTGTSTSSAASTDATVLANSAACMLFHVFLRTLLNNVFDDDLAIPGVGLDSGYAVRGMLYMLDPENLGTNKDQSFCNNVNATGQTIGGTTSCGVQVITALTTAYETLAGYKGAPTNWLWGQAHTLTTVSPASPIVDGTFGAGPYARPGGALTVDVGNPSLDTQANPFDFSYGSGSNLRFIAAVDPTSPTTLMQLPGQERDGPEGVFASSPDLIGQYAQNLYFPFLYSAQIAQGAVETQTFTAASAASGSRTR